MTNFMNIRPSILELLHAYRLASPETTFKDDVIALAHRGPSVVDETSVT
jgi:hypothetical protein